MKIEYDNAYRRSVATDGIRGYKKCYLPYYSLNYNSQIVDKSVSEELLKHIKR